MAANSRAPPTQSTPYAMTSRPAPSSQPTTTARPPPPSTYSHPPRPAIPPTSSQPPPRTFQPPCIPLTITTHKAPILKAGPIDALTSRLTIAPPEMIFGDNFVRIEHLPTKWGIVFTAEGALDTVDKEGSGGLKVVYSEEWARSREGGVDGGGEKVGSGKKGNGLDALGLKLGMEVVRPFDWSYSPREWRGDVYTSTQVGEAEGKRRKLQFEEQPESKQIPLELLKRPDPILFFDDVILYEDELADNGIAMLSVKVRVMPARLLLLSRFFMRLDGVLLRVRDTRVYIEFATGEVIREYVEKEEEYDSVKERVARSGRDDVSAALRDANLMAETVKIVSRKVDALSLTA